MTAMGMKSVEEVERIAADLKNRGQEITTLVGTIEKLVTTLRANWDGRDADQFVNEWWPQHKRSLQQAAEQITGLGQSADINAKRQREVSNG